jgi:ribosomal-protein-serine acetyltransferase
MDELTLQAAPDLKLASARASHAPALLELILRNRSHIGRYLPKVTEIDSLEKTEAHLARCREGFRTRELFEFHVFDGNELCGIVRLNHFDWEHRKAAIAYLLDQAHQGRGIITRAARAALGYAFHDLGLHRMELRCSTRNTGSKRVAERLGFTLEGTLREVEWFEGAPEDEFVYGLLSREFDTDQP